MDSYSNQPDYQPAYPTPAANENPANSFVKASLVMGILTIIVTFTCTVYFTFVFGSLTILFALLSKGQDKKMHTNAKVGITTAIIGLIFNMVLITVSFYLVISVPEYREATNKISQQLYGKSFDDLIEDSFSGE